jgi:hypothetical protein
VNIISKILLNAGRKIVEVDYRQPVNPVGVYHLSNTNGLNIRDNKGITSLPFNAIIFLVGTYRFHYLIRHHAVAARSFRINRNEPEFLVV